jgi:predicted TIM-barrel fold metal-dependent hydrolase
VVAENPAASRHDRSERGIRSRFFDTHVHFWDLSAPDLSYEWLQPGVAHPLLGSLDRIRAPLYDAAAFAAESRFAGVGGLILVEAEAANAAEDPVLETRWFTRQAAALDVPVGIVVHADLSDDNAEASLARHCESPLVRGVRDFTDAAKLLDADFRRGYSALAKYDLVYDLDCVWEHLANARRLAESHPDVILVVEHDAFPARRDEEYFNAWRLAMSDAARAENAVCKISGLGMGDHNWTMDSLRPWVEHAIDSFGVTRCFFGTNWPVDRLYSSYDALINAYDMLIGGLSQGERASLFYDNAARIYRTSMA